jgi:predicted MPP superfamily phosphohydrolase
VGVIVFVGIILVITGLIHLYLWRRLVRDTTRAGRWRRAGTIAIVALAVLIPATLIGGRAGLGALSWPGYLWLAVMFYLLVILALLEIPMLVARRVVARRSSVAVGRPATTPPGPPAPSAPDGPAEPDGPESPDRRLLLARGAAIFAGLTAASLTGYGVRTALSAPRVDRVRIDLAKLPRTMDGLRIATVSDIHLGPLAGRAHAERIVSVINSVDADIVAVVGDLVDGTVAELGAAAEPLRGIRSRLGAYFVTGNHEYYSGVDEWIAEVARLGMRPLRNERLELEGIDLAGVNDLAGGDTGGPDFDAALADRDPSRPVVLLAHQPVLVEDAARYGVDLQLSGHTHGGQIVPFNLIVRLEQPVVSGYGSFDGTQLYVTNGAGFWGPPVRVGAPPQVTLVELRSSA